MYQELVLESLADRRKIRRLCLFFKIYTTEAPSYLYKLIPVKNNFYNTRNDEQIPEIPSQTNHFKNSFFPNAISEWNKLDKHIRNSKSYSIFRNSLIKFLRPSSNSVFAVRDLNGLKLLTRLRLGLSHLREHKFNHNLYDNINPLCPSLTFFCVANFSSVKEPSSRMIFEKLM